MPPLAYFISFRTYGSWLHGHPSGSVDKAHNRPGTPLLEPNPGREAFEQRLLRHPPVELDENQRYVIDAAIRAVCIHRGWTLHALHVRTTHVHAVVSAPAPPERVMNAFKSWSTRRMAESGVLPRGVKAWALHGSTRHLHTSESAATAIQYTLEEQGQPLPMTRPPGWRDEWN